MRATIKTRGSQAEPAKYRIKTPTPMILQVAQTTTTGTQPRSLTMTLQLLADHNFL
jgi:hypothetical protein